MLSGDFLSINEKNENKRFSHSCIVRKFGPTYALWHLSHMRKPLFKQACVAIKWDYRPTFNLSLADCHTPEDGNTQEDGNYN